jgi:hypothetical protein
VKGAVGTVVQREDKVYARLEVSGAAEFPEEFVAACAHHYKRTTRDLVTFAKHRRAGRSFPTDYMIEGLTESTETHWDRVVVELGRYRGRGGRIFSQTKQSLDADKRVFAGPSVLDAQELPRIDDAWCVAEFICAELGLRTETWSRKGLRLAHVRYGMMLDWLTRDVAQRLVRESDGLARLDAWERYGLDPMRVAMEHGAVPDELDELASATGLYKRGALSPFGTPTKTRHTSERIAPESDPGFREIKALKERLARKDDAG